MTDGAHSHQVEHHERKMDAKIDMMNQTRLRRPAQHIHSSADETEEEDQTHELARLPNLCAVRSALY